MDWKTIYIRSKRSIYNCIKLYFRRFFIYVMAIPFNYGIICTRKISPSIFYYNKYYRFYYSRVLLGINRHSFKYDYLKNFSKCLV